MCVICILCTQIPPRSKTQKIINSKQCPPQPDKADKEKRSKNPAAVSCVGPSSIGGPKRRSSEAERVQSDSSRNESVVCLTQEQFQQILSTISSSSAANTHTHTGQLLQRRTCCFMINTQLILKRDIRTFSYCYYPSYWDSIPFHDFFLKLILLFVSISIRCPFGV